MDFIASLRPSPCSSCPNDLRLVIGGPARDQSRASHSLLHPHPHTTVRSEALTAPNPPMAILRPQHQYLAPRLSTTRSWTNLRVCVSYRPMHSYLVRRGRQALLPYPTRPSSPQDPPRLREHRRSEMTTSRAKLCKQSFRVADPTLTSGERCRWSSRCTYCA